MQAKKIATEKVIADLEEQFIINTLKKTAGNVSKAAEKAGMNRSYFQKLMKKYGFSAGDFRT